MLRKDCRTALIRPLDHGRPITFYGFLTADCIVEFGPFEALVFQDRITRRVTAPGILRPVVGGPALAEARRAVHKAARRLYERVGYQGAFGTDGVLTVDQYVIHEINPRVCAGFRLLDHMCPTAVPLAAVDLLLRELGASAANRLNDPLVRTAREIENDTGHRLRLWEPSLRPLEHRLVASAPAHHDPSDWSRSIRQHIAAFGLVHLTDPEPGDLRAIDPH